MADYAALSQGSAVRDWNIPKDTALVPVEDTLAAGVKGTAELASQINDLASQATMLADHFCGAAPQQAGNPAPPNAPGVVNEMHANLRIGFASLSSLREAIQRLARKIG